jgi:hypothetical protein
MPDEKMPAEPGQDASTQADAETTAAAPAMEGAAAPITPIPAKGTAEVIRCASERKRAAFVALLDDAAFEKVLVFTRSKRSVDRIAGFLSGIGIAAHGVHANTSDESRALALSAIRDGKARVLVVTDVSASGLDTGPVTHVVHFEQPNTIDEYDGRLMLVRTAEPPLGLVVFAAIEEKESVAAIEARLGAPLAFRALPPGTERVMKQLEGKTAKTKSSGPGEGAAKFERGTRSIDKGRRNDRPIAGRPAPWRAPREGDPGGNDRDERGGSGPARGGYRGRDGGDGYRSDRGGYRGDRGGDRDRPRGRWGDRDRDERPRFRDDDRRSPQDEAAASAGESSDVTSETMSTEAAAPERRDERPSSGRWERRDDRGPPRGRFSRDGDRRGGRGREDRGGFGRGREDRGGFGRGREDRGGFGRGREDRGGFGRGREDRGARGGFGRGRDDRGSDGDRGRWRSREDRDGERGGERGDDRPAWKPREDRGGFGRGREDRGGRGGFGRGRDGGGRGGDRGSRSFGRSSGGRGGDRGRGREDRGADRGRDTDTSNDE